MLWPLGPCSWKVLEINTSVASVPFPCKTPTQSSSPSPPLPGSQPCGHYSSVSITPGPGTRQLRTFPLVLSLQKRFKPADPASAHPACSLLPSCSNHGRLLPTFSPHPLCLLTHPRRTQVLPGTAPRVWGVCAPLLRNSE